LEYTSLNAVLKNDFTVFQKQENTVQYSDVKNTFFYEIDSYKIVFIDGVFSSHLSATTHEGIDVCLLSSALTKSKYKTLLIHISIKCK
jgi:Fe-S cluster assembly protein SufD